MGSLINKETFEIFILPSLAFLIAIFSLFFNPDTVPYKKFWFIFAVIILTVTLIFQIDVNQKNNTESNLEIVERKTVLFNTEELKTNSENLKQISSEQKKSIEELNNLAIERSKTIKELNSLATEQNQSITKLRELALKQDKSISSVSKIAVETYRNTEELKDILAQSGLDPSVSNKVINSLEAKENLNQNKSRINSTASRRSRFTVQYFAKDVDRGVVENNIKQLGFGTVRIERPVNNLPTNTVWFGENVNSEDIKFLAYTLVQAGVQIKAIRPFDQPSGNKALRIQIGASPGTVESCPTWTLESIKKAVEFTRNNFGCM